MFNRRLSVGWRFAITHGKAVITVERTNFDRYVVEATPGFHVEGASFWRRLVGWPGGELVLTRGGESCQLLFNGTSPRHVWIHAPRSFVAGPALRRRHSA